MFGAADVIIRTAQAGAEERSSGQIGLFGGVEPEPMRVPVASPWMDGEKLGFEAEAIGFHVSAHPMDAYAPSLKRLDVTVSGAILRRAEAGGCRLKLAGMLGARKERITRTGSRRMWATLSDTQGSFEVTLFSEVLNRSREMLVDGAALLVTADVRMDGEALRITASDIARLDEAAAQAGAGIKIWLDQTEALGPIKLLLEQEGRGKGRVVLAPKTGLERTLEITLPGGYNVSPRLAQAVKMIDGVELVEDV